ncbi:MAG: ATP-dependent helicase, partial [Bifidobacteriaceae bacterium]|nr:ATP-dependent helicase [Bifidobacteriaceae bacterium]
MGGPVERFSPLHIARVLGQPRPTEEQVAVIGAPLAPVLVVAGAGSGKTETMAARVVYLVANGLVRPDQVLGLTFTRKAAAELADRIRVRLRALNVAGVHPPDLHDPSDADVSFLALGQPTIATYNSYAASVVRDHGLRLGVDPEARLLTEGGRWQLLEHIVGTWQEGLETEASPNSVVEAVAHLADQLAEHGVAPSEAAEAIRSIAQTIASTPPAGRSKTLNQTLRAVVASLTTRSEILLLVEAYTAAKAERGMLDYADQVAIAARLVASDPAISTAERSRFEAVLLDEYQDTSPGQERLLAGLFGHAHPVMAVGDLHQSIYGWRGASAAGMARFPEHFHGADGTLPPVLTLSVAWRNDRAILNAANAMVDALSVSGGTPLSVGVTRLRPRPGVGDGQVEYRFLQTEAEEATAIAQYLREHWRPEPGGPTAAVLCRKRSQFVPVAEALREAEIPYEVVGLGGLLSVPEVQDIVAALSAAHDPTRADALMRLLTSPRMRIGIADLEALAASARHLSADREGSPVRARGDSIEADGVEEHSIVDAVEDLPRAETAGRYARTMTPAARRRLSRLAQVLRDLRALSHVPLP